MKKPGEIIEAFIRLCRGNAPSDRRTRRPALRDREGFRALGCSRGGFLPGPFFHRCFLWKLKERGAYRIACAPTLWDRGSLH